MTLEQGEPAPWRGDLVWPERLLSLGMQIEDAIEAARRDLEAAEQAHRIELMRVEEKALLRERAMQRELDFYRAWYRQPEVVAAITAAVGLVAVLASVAVYDGINAARAGLGTVP